MRYQTLRIPVVLRAAAPSARKTGEQAGRLECLECRESSGALGQDGGVGDAPYLLVLYNFQSRIIKPNLGFSKPI